LSGRVSTTYVVEVLTHVTGTTLYVYEKGQTREHALTLTDSRAVTDWGTARSFVQTLGQPDQTSNSVTLDNMAELTGSGGLVGDLAVFARYTDSVVDYFYDATGRLIGTLDELGNLSAVEYDAAAMCCVNVSPSAVSLASRVHGFSHDAIGLAGLAQPSDRVPSISTMNKDGVSRSSTRRAC